MTDPKRRALHTVLVDCLAVRKNESVLIITDPPRMALARQLISFARRLGGEAVLVEMVERASSGSEPPPAVAAAMLKSDVLLLATSQSLSHTEARYQATQNGARIASMPLVTEEMLVRTMSGDYVEVKRRSRELAGLLTAGSEVRITSYEGTDLTLTIGGRDALPDDGDLTQPGAFGNLPAGEAFIAPVEGRSEGVIVFDGSMWGVGLLEHPLVATITGGHASFSGYAAAKLDEQLRRFGHDAYAVAELGIGTNETAILTGNVLEDEKILGTAHVAFGDNHSFGGTLRVASHHDGVMTEPTVIIDGTVVLEKGRLLM